MIFCFQAFDREFLLRVSYLEIYNENVVDLLGDVTQHLEVREHNNKVFVQDIREEMVTSAQCIYDCIQKGESKGYTQFSKHTFIREQNCLLTIR